MFGTAYQLIDDDDDTDPDVLRLVEEAAESKAAALDLNFKSLKALPKSLTALRTHLEDLAVDNNFELRALTPVIGSLTKLRRLNASYCGLVGLGADIGRLTRLETLHLSNNALTALPPEIRHLRALRELRLDNNRLRLLPGGMLFLQHLKTLTLENNPYFTLAEMEREMRVTGGGPDSLVPADALPDYTDCASCCNHTARAVTTVGVHTLAGERLPFVFYTCSKECEKHLLRRLQDRELAVVKD